MKTYIANIVLFCTILVNLSSCFDMDLDGLDLMGTAFSYGGTYGGGNYGGTTPTYSATCFFDSVVQVNDSTIKIWSHIQYDSVLIIKNHSVKYWDENGNEVFKSIQTTPDTINFRNLTDSTLAWTGRYEWAYHYSLEVDSLKKDFDYLLHVTTSYKEKNETKSFYNSVLARLK